MLASRKISLRKVARVMSIARGQFFFGWRIAAVGFIVQATAVSLEVHGIGVFLKPMSGELGWTRTMFVGVQSFSTIVQGLASFLVGPIVDVRGARGVVVLGAIVGGAAFAALGLVRGLLDFYFIRGIVTPIAVTCAGTITLNVAVSNWFVRKRGKAIAFSGMGAGFGPMVLVPVATFLTVSFGWRMAWVILGFALWLLIIPPAAAFIRRRPEDIGLLPDGDSPTGDEGQGPGVGGETAGPLATTARRAPARPLSLVTEVTWTRPEAMRTSALWLTIFAYSLGTIGNNSTIGIHLLPFLTDIGLTAATAAMAYSLRGAMVLVTKPIWGILVDRFQVRHCSLAALALSALAMALFVLLSLWPAYWLSFLAVAVSGIAAGGIMPSQEVLWANNFGRLSLGAVRTLAIPFSMVFSAGAPLFAAWAYDNFQGYQFAFGVLTAIHAIAVVLVYFVRPPEKKPQGLKA